MNESMMEMLNVLREQIKEDTEKCLKQVEENITQTINKKIDEKFNKIESDIEVIQKIQEEHGKKLEYFERKLRQRNLIFFGIAEEENNYAELVDIVLQIIHLKMEIQCDKNEIEFIGRMGRKNTKPRPIRVTLTTFGKKIEILQKKSALEGSGSYVKEDYPPEVLEKRKSLIPQLLEHRKNGVTAILKYDRLIVNNKNTNKRALSTSPSDPSVGSNNALERPVQAAKKTKTLPRTTPGSFFSKQPKAAISIQHTNSSITSFMKKVSPSGKPSQTNDNKE